MKKYFFFLIFFGSVVSNATTIIHDGGNTLSIQPYLPNSNNKKPPQKKIPASTVPMNILPVRSSLLTPGKVSPREHHIPHFQIPLFIIGSDERSKEWLIQRLDELQRLNAVGMVVNVQNTSQFNELKRIAKDVWIFPASGDDIAREINLVHYPVLISKVGIEQ